MTALILTYLIISPAAAAASPELRPVHLRDVGSLSLQHGQFTTARRAAPVPQARVTGGSARGLFTPSTIQCYNPAINRGPSSGHTHHTHYAPPNNPGAPTPSPTQWLCTAPELSSDSAYTIGDYVVTCEGYSSPSDAYILDGSCGIEYTLELTANGLKRGHGRGGAWRGQRRAYFHHPSRGQQHHGQQLRQHPQHGQRIDGTPGCGGSFFTNAFKFFLVLSLGGGSLVGAGFIWLWLTYPCFMFKGAVILAVLGMFKKAACGMCGSKTGRRGTNNTETDTRPRPCWSRGHCGDEPQQGSGGIPCPLFRRMRACFTRPCFMRCFTRAATNGQEQPDTPTNSDTTSSVTAQAHGPGSTPTADPQTGSTKNSEIKHKCAGNVPSATKQQPATTKNAAAGTQQQPTTPKSVTAIAQPTQHHTAATASTPAQPTRHQTANTVSTPAQGGGPGQTTNQMRNDAVKQAFLRANKSQLSELRQRQARNGGN